MTETVSKQFGPDWQESFLEILSSFKGGSEMTPLGSRLFCRNRHHEPGELMWFHGLRAPLSSANLQNVGEELASTPHPDLLAFLKFANGAHLFGHTINLFGFTNRITDRSLDGAWDRPISLRYGNQVERVLGQPDDAICLGSMMAGYHSNSPIYLFPCGKVVLVTHHDFNRVAKEWPSFEVMLASEAERLSEYFDTDGKPVGGEYDHLLPELADWEHFRAAEYVEREHEKRLTSRLRKAVNSLWSKT